MARWNAPTKPPSLVGVSATTSSSALTVENTSETIWKSAETIRASILSKPVTEFITTAIPPPGSAAMAGSSPSKAMLRTGLPSASKMRMIAIPRTSAITAKPPPSSRVMSPFSPSGMSARVPSSIRVGAEVMAMAVFLCDECAGRGSPLEYAAR